MRTFLRICVGLSSIGHRPTPHAHNYTDQHPTHFNVTHKWLHHAYAWSGVTPPCICVESSLKPRPRVTPSPSSHAYA
ncbi:hypothetical protein PIB30_108056, partial [Stylosanthes scabra]|nr:hypothetical protein [Stylosanthes scabra]